MGSHAVHHQHSLEQIRSIVKALDSSGVEMIAAARECVANARLATLLIPGIGTVHDLNAAWNAGVSIIRVAMHCTEADISRQNNEAVRKLGMDKLVF